MQKRIMSIDIEVKKQLTLTNSYKRDFDGVSEMRDIMLEKKQILYNTYTTLKRDIHTRKQMHKMTIVSQILKKKRDLTKNAIDQVSGANQSVDDMESERVGPLQ